MQVLDKENGAGNTPPDLDTIYTAVASEAVLTLRRYGLIPVHHAGS